MTNVDQPSAETAEQRTPGVNRLAVTGPPDLLNETSFPAKKCFLANRLPARCCPLTFLVTEHRPETVKFHGEIVRTPETRPCAEICNIV